MKLTKTQLKQIIKEELESIQEVDVDLMTDAEKLGIILQALGQLAYNFTPVVLGTITLAALKRAVGLKDPAEVKAVAVQAAEEHKASK